MATYLVLLLGTVWTLYSAAVLWNLFHIPRLPGVEELQGQIPASQRPATERAATVSVVIAARNEAKRIGQTVDQLLAQRGVEIEVIAVDDRSTDETPQILAAIAVREPRLRVVRVDELPDGWLGKCHACYRGAQQASGQWILFTDADIHMRPDVIARAVATAERDGADHIALWPGISCTGVWTRATVLGWVEMFSLFAPAAAINRDRGSRAVGVGAFNLVRAEVYRAIGGYERLRMEVVDDVKLGLLVRRGGYRQRLYSGTADIEADWAVSVLGAIRLLEKNWFAGVQFNIAIGTAVIVIFLGAWLGAIVAPLVAPGVGWLATAGWFSTAVPAAIQARMFGWPWGAALLTPLMIVVFPLAGIRSMWCTLRQGGIRWRDTFYPLSQLRAGMVPWRE